ncbi:MAG: hypothetical protein JXD21_02920 [Candidatus Omnitrophica bacterium]|nr:hypothetical protein [Candidatus Omnitrophota bacterium]
MKKKSGCFTVEADNLIYYPHDKNVKVRVNGKWALDRAHNLIFIVDRSMNQRFGETISFQTKIEAAAGDRIVFKTLQRKTPLHREIRRIYLDGVWSMDAYHRLKFTVKKDKRSGELLFKNQWQVLKNNQLIYSYRKNLKDRAEFHSFLLQGRWEFAGRRLTYKVDATPDAALNITVSRKKIPCNPADKKIDFEYGFGYQRQNRVRVKKRICSLFGTWKIYSKTKIGFIMSYGPKEKTMWTFPVTVTYKGNRIELEVKKRQGTPVFGKMALLKDVGKDKGFFVTFSKKPHDFSIDTGLRIVF